MHFPPFSRDRSPHSPGSPWSSFLRQSPGLYTSGLRSSSLPGTPSELRSTLGHEENPFSESFGAAPAPAFAALTSTKNDLASADGNPAAHGRPPKKRALSVSASTEVQSDGKPAREAFRKEASASGAQDPFAVASYASERPALDPAQKTDSSRGYSGSGSDASKMYSLTPETSVTSSPKPYMNLFDQLNASLVASSNDISYNYYQPAPQGLEYPYSNLSDLSSFDLGAAHHHQSSGLDSFVFQPYTPTIPLLPVTNPFDDAARSSSVSFTPDPHLELHQPNVSATASPSPEPVAAAPGPKKRGRKPRDPTAPVDQEKVTKQRLSALERNRIAASKSRQKKKEKVNEAESAVFLLCTKASSLQHTANSLRAELYALRKQVDHLHPNQSLCQCHHIKGYLRREAEGGGIPTLDRLAGPTLTRDYSRSGWISAQQGGAGGGESTAGGGARSESGEPTPVVQVPVEVERPPLEPMPEGRVAIPLRGAK